MWQEKRNGKRIFERETQKGCWFVLQYFCEDDHADILLTCFLGERYQKNPREEENKIRCRNMRHFHSVACFSSICMHSKSHANGGGSEKCKTHIKTTEYQQFEKVHKIILQL